MFINRGTTITARAPITIESDVWIGAAAVVLPGVTLGHGCIVAAGAVVIKDVQPLTIAVGVPARVVRHRGAPWTSADS